MPHSKPPSFLAQRHRASGITQQRHGLPTASAFSWPTLQPKRHTHTQRETIPEDIQNARTMGRYITPQEELRFQVEPERYRFDPRFAGRTKWNK